ncbi:hypothetical protein V492_06400 [Pseudogymnoascus sp. VKM F-4246]|nr:hypothetical protein V492_06400 [Pseudogymnoascus sp. VKM F-4246]
MPPSAVISAKAAAGRSVVTTESGAGLLAVTGRETGTRAATGDSATSSSRVEKTATTPLNAGAAAKRTQEEGLISA